jgi:hypothetical protein
LVPPPVEPIRLVAPKEPEPVVVETTEEHWYDQMEVGAFVDAYFSLNAGFPKPESGRNRFRAYDTNNGFSLSWVGLDFSYQRERVGGTLDLRFGPTAGRATGEPDTSAGLHVVKQGFATWRPSEVVTLDFGKFNTIYGAEAAESQLNYNYTRGLVNWLAQPVFHTGLRANFDLSPQFWITGLLVNGWNNSVDNNFGKSFGVQLSTAVQNATDAEAAPIFDAHLGYLVGPEQADVGVFRNYCDVPGETLNPRALTCDASVGEVVDANGNSNSDRPVDASDGNSAGLRHLIDLVIGVNPSDTFSMLLNFDYGLENVREDDLELTQADAQPNGDVTLPGFASESFWGLAAMARLQFNDEWAGALRGEVYSDPDGRASNDGDLYVFAQPDVMLYSATLTAEVVPSDGLILRLDNRLDASSEDVFPSKVRTYGSTQFTSTLGVVVTTD